MPGANTIDFPHFGKYNLDEWKIISGGNEEVGEYGYGRTYTLMNVNKEVFTPA